MPRPIERLFTMDEMIRSGNYPSIIDFRRRFEISARAAYGDVQYLRRHFHAPIQWNRKQGGYFYTLIGWSLARYASEEEMNLLPTRWLWQEITRRFGKEAALTLHHDYKLHLAEVQKL